MNRRNFLMVSMLIVAGFLNGCRASQNTITDQSLTSGRPNILFIMSDDHATQAFGVYGSRLASLNPTPNLDQIAREGIIFDNMYCTNSICTPSRACIMTGQYSQTNGVLDLGGNLPPEKQYLPIEMKKRGYQTAMIGKWHLVKEPAAYDYYKVLPVQGKYHNPEFREMGKGKWPNNIVKHQGHSSDVITDISLEWLKQRDKTKPFFMMHHYKAPHDLFENAKRYDSYLEDIEIPEPDNLYDQPAPGFGSVATRGEDDSLIHDIGSSVSKRNPTRNMGQHMEVDQNLPDREYTHQAYQRYLKRYLRCVKGVDDNIKRIVDYLKDEGVYDNTVIIYTGDQGFMLGEHDYIDKRWMYEESMRMPFFVRYPKIIKAGTRTDLLANNTDFAPTMLELAGATVPEAMQGRSFVRTLAGKPEKNWRTETYYRYWMHMAHKHANPAHFGIRTKDYKLIFFYGMDYVVEKREIWGGRNDWPTPPGWELYDLKKDPREMNNVYADPKYASVVRDLKARLKKIREELNETDEKYPHIQKVIDEHWND